MKIVNSIQRATYREVRMGRRIERIGHEVAAPANAEVLELKGYTVLPGLVGMHDHMYYLQRPNTDASGSGGPILLPQMTFSAPRMYLANGVTTIRNRVRSKRTYTCECRTSAQTLATIVEITRRRAVNRVDKLSTITRGIVDLHPGPHS